MREYIISDRTCVLLIERSIACPCGIFEGLKIAQDKVAAKYSLQKPTLGFVITTDVDNLMFKDAMHTWYVCIGCVSDYLTWFFGSVTGYSSLS